MKRWLPFLPFIIFLVLIGVFILSLGRNTTLSANGMVGKNFPAFQLQTLNENSVAGVAQPVISLTDLQQQLPKDKPWLLNVWASWCPQCYAEHGFIEALAANGAAVIGMNYKDKQPDAVGYLKKMGNPYAVILADTTGSLGIDLGVSGAPETFLISATGEILVWHAGVLDRRVWDEKFAPQWLDEAGTPVFKHTANQDE